MTINVLLGSFDRMLLVGLNVILVLRDSIDRDRQERLEVFVLLLLLQVVGELGIGLLQPRHFVDGVLEVAHIHAVGLE